MISSDSDTGPGRVGAEAIGGNFDGEGEERVVGKASGASPEGRQRLHVSDLCEDINRRGTDIGHMFDFEELAQPTRRIFIADVADEIARQKPHIRVCIGKCLR